MAPLTIMIANMFSYVIPPAAIETRFTLSTSSLVSLVLFHAGLKAQTPLAGVLTLADQLMIGAYLSVLASLLLSALLLTLRFTTTASGEPHLPAQRFATILFESTRLVGPLLSTIFFFGNVVIHAPSAILAATAAALLCICCLLPLTRRCLGGQVHMHMPWEAVKRGAAGRRYMRVMGGASMDQPSPQPPPQPPPQSPPQLPHRRRSLPPRIDTALPPRCAKVTSSHSCTSDVYFASTSSTASNMTCL
mmetsp:Transcript_13785/g.27738  ORF Transcript_13785/g.27738 Transcript_13785/m.27738 type:complete len:248 (+) Transcript_13785:740-1483(+)